MADEHAVTLRQLYKSAQRGDVVQVQALLAVLAVLEVLPFMDCALTAAVRNDHANTVAMFAARGFDTQMASCTTLLDRAARHGSVHVVPVLVAAKASIDGADLTYERPLYTAAGKGHLSCVSLLLAMKARTEVDRANRSALHVAACRGHADVVECLLLAKVDHRHINGCDETAVYSAAAGMHAPTLHVLLGARADVNFITPWGYTALSMAVANECPDAVIKLLLRAKAHVHSMSKFTALHEAAALGRHTIARLLVRAKADVHAITMLGKTAATVALQNKHFELAKYLEAVRELQRT
jgi:ankyrin repeat protein